MIDTPPRDERATAVAVRVATHVLYPLAIPYRAATTAFGDALDELLTMGVPAWPARAVAAQVVPTAVVHERGQRMTIMVAVRQLLQIEGRDAHEVADAVMEHLVELAESAGSQVLDSAVDADGINGTLDVEVTVEASDLGGAVNVAVAAMRTAIHTAGGNTAQWITPAQMQALIDSIGDDLRVNRLEPVG